MYIEFQLPRDDDDVAAVIHHLLSRNLLQWSERYRVAYNKKTIKYTVKVTFDSDAHYDFFALTSQPPGEQYQDYLSNYRFIEPMSRV